MKKIYTSLMMLLLIGCYSKVIAQAGVPMSLRGDFNRMQSNMANQLASQRLNQHWYYSMDYLLNAKYKFKVLMKDSTVKEVKSKIYVDTSTHKSYLLYDKGQPVKIYCNQTLSITRANGNINHIGMATDSCWLFPTFRGNISAYSPLSETDNINSDYLSAFQVGNGPILKLDSATLVPFIKDNPKALKAINKNDFYKAIVKYNGY